MRTERNHFLIHANILTMISRSLCYCYENAFALEYVDIWIILKKIQ